MNKLIGRRITPIIQNQLAKFPVIAVTGPRQSGKTTLLRSLFADYKYVSLESPNVRSFASEDPIGFLNQYSQNVIFDEVQRVPELFSYIQTRVDESGQMGQFILSGSQNFHLVNNITQSLAGRVALFKLLPFDFGELRSGNLLEEKYQNVAIRGFYPAIFGRGIDPTVFYSNYIQTYIEKDITDLLHIRDLKLFRTFIGLCAGRAGQLLNYSALANDCDISHNTAKAWLSLLESSYIIFFLQPYHQNFNKRLIKTPKLYFYDTGLLAYLLGITAIGELEDTGSKGAIFENMIVAEFQKKNHHLYLHEDYFFWQDSNANEIDLLQKTVSGFSLYEIKATETINSGLFKQMDRFESIANPATIAKTLIYGGSESQNRTKYRVVSWRDVY